MDTTLHLPWTNEVLEELVLKTVKMGETTKLDFKSIWSLGSPGERAEFAKDVQAMANSMDPSYRNHGFLILGAKPGELVYSAFAENADKMQSTVDQVLREHLGPFVPTQVRQFGSGRKTWGVIVVPPSRNAPHIFVRDTDKFKRGDIFIRVGTTTAKAEPADFARFFRIHLEDHGRELRDELRDLQREVEKLKTAGGAAAVPASLATSHSQTASAPVAPEAEPVTPTGVLDVVQRALKKATDPVGAALTTESAELRRFLLSKEIPWDLNNVSRVNGPAFIDAINERASPLWKALATVVENDDGGVYDGAVLEVLNDLAFDPQSPSGTTFTGYGTGIRLYPLTMALYIVFMVGLRKKRLKLLKEVASLSLSRRSHHEEPLPIGTALMYVRRASDVFQTVQENYPKQGWCDAVGSYVHRWMNAHLFPEFSVLERHEHFLYIGEFVLSLLAASSENLRRPAPGAFFFSDESDAIIRRYLKTENSVLKELFGIQLKPALERFDGMGHQIANAGGCWGDGFQRGATELVFTQEKSATP